jgi:hypothetical protein
MTIMMRLNAYWCHTADYLCGEVKLDPQYPAFGRSVQSVARIDARRNFPSLGRRRTFYIIIAEMINFHVALL